MKLVNYQLQTQIEYLCEGKSTTFFKDYLQLLIEDINKPYYQRADYIGLSLQELKLKIETLSNDITELQQLKKKLSASLDIAKEITALIFIENGIFFCAYTTSLQVGEVPNPPIVTALALSCILPTISILII